MTVPTEAAHFCRAMLQRMDKPKHFYKYRSLSGTSALHVGQSVFEHKFFFDSPNNFNDPFECLPHFVFEATPAERIDFITGWLMRNSRMSEQEARMQALQHDLKGTRPNLEFMFDTYRAETVVKLPMFCLSEVADNVLMWSHYANNHAGICFEFDGHSDIFKDAHQVTYDEKRVKIDIPGKRDPDQVGNAATTKGIDWSYEKEWRLIDPGKKRGVRTWPATTLIAIIMGDRISVEDASRVRGWVKRRTLPIALRQARISRTEFKVDINDVT